MDKETSVEKRFTAAWLPWVIAAGALVVYLATLNPLATFNSLAPVTRVSGFSWIPELFGPLVYLVTYPFRWLPVALLPVAINAFTAVCAALTLALLARSVALLPHDRTDEQRRRERSEHALLSFPLAWVPPLFAVMVCGLQLSFWENATAATGEMVDLLVFAYVVRCFLEYRIDERDSWLYRAAFVFALGVTNNWGLISFFPAVLVALIWTKRLGFFHGPFLIRLALCGFAGLLLYLLLPFITSHSENAAIPFWPALKYTIATQKQSLLHVYRNGRPVILVFCLTSIVPLFLIGIRWASSFGDSSKLGAALATFMFHLVNAFFLLACVWIALDPAVSPRNKGAELPFRPLLPFLSLYYLGALSAGYFVGYFLLVFSGPPAGGPRTPGIIRWLRPRIQILVWALIALAPTLLIYRNLPQIRFTNGMAYKNFAALTAKGLPNHGLALSDDLRRTYLTKLALTQTGTASNYLFLDTEAFRWPAYQKFIARSNPKLWTTSIPTNRTDALAPMEMYQLVGELMKSNTVSYLHPSFGYYFEFFWLEPNGIASTLKPFPKDDVLLPALSPELIEQNQRFWSDAEDSALKPVAAALNNPGPARKIEFLEYLMRKLRLKHELNRDAQGLGAWYSRSADFWGVQLQRAGRLPAAGRLFQTALELNPENVAARVNLDCNANLVAGRKTNNQLARSVEEQFGKYRNWNDVVGENGPFDDPNFCFEQGRVAVRSELYRQAIHQFERASALDPDNIGARMWLAQLYVLSKKPADAVEVIKALHERKELRDAANTNRIQLLLVEISSHLASQDLPGAEQVIQRALKSFPADEGIISTAARAYMNFDFFTNAVEMLDQQLLISSNNVGTLVNKGFCCLQSQRYPLAIATLKQALLIETNAASVNYSSAMLDLAIALLRNGNLEEAKELYQKLQKMYPNAFQIPFGLGEIAYLQKDTNAAVRNYELYLTMTVTNTAEGRVILSRLRELRPK